VGVSDTTGFVLYRVIYGWVRVLPMAGYGVHGYRCGVGKSNPRVTRFKPYSLQTPYIHHLTLQSSSQRSNMCCWCGTPLFNPPPCQCVSLAQLGTLQPSASSEDLPPSSSLMHSKVPLGNNTHIIQQEGSCMHCVFEGQ